MYTAISIVVMLIAAVFIFYAGKILVRFSWIFGWLRGMAGLSLLFVAAILIFSGLDLISYKRLTDDKPILTISFEKEDEQRYKTTVSYIDINEDQSYVLHGDQWQVDARVIRWRGVMQMFGAKPGYRLDRLVGRYYSLEDERRKPRSLHKLSESAYLIDTWQWMQENGRFVPLFDAIYGSATYLPMADGAIYQVSLSASGLVAKPMNSSAKGAVNQWE